MGNMCEDLNKCPMTFNQKIMAKYVNDYKRLYKKNNGENPTSWWGFTTWLSNSTMANSFDKEDIDFAKKLLA